MRLFAAMWPIAVAIWGCLLPSYILPHIDSYLHNHDGLYIARIYGESAVLCSPLMLVVGLLSITGACLTAGIARADVTVHLSIICTWVARILIIASACSLANNWIKSLDPTFQLLSTYKRLILAFIIVSCVASSWLNARPGGVLHGLAPIALASIPVVFIAMMFHLPPPNRSDAMAAVRTGNELASRNISAPRDVVLITIDALSAEHTSIYQHNRDTTPNLRRLADKAIIFDRFYANGNWTQPGTASLLSGRRPWLTGADNPGKGPDPAAMEHNLLQIAHEAGYSVLTVSTNYNATPDRQKVDHWVNYQAFPTPTDAIIFFHYLIEWKLGFTSAAADLATSFQDSVGQFQPILDRFFDGGSNLHYDPRPAFSTAQAFWVQHAGESRFLWVHILPPHDPYAAPEPFIGRFDPVMMHNSYSTSSVNTQDSGSLLWYGAIGQQKLLNQLSDRYDESILYADFYVGHFLDWLDRRGDLNPSLLIVTADHGESFHHEYSAHGGPGLYEELIRIPLIIKCPNSNQGRRIGEIAEQVDLAPTLAHLLAVPMPTPTYEGKVLSMDPGIAIDKHAPAYSMSLAENLNSNELRNGSIAMVDGPYKYVHYFGHLRYPHMPQLEDELYNVVADPLEVHNLISTDQELASKMKGEIEAQMASHDRHSHDIQTVPN